MKSLVFRTNSCRLPIGLARSLCFVALAFIPASGFASDLVKMTSSGICHPKASGYYDRISNYEPYPSLDACVAEGGRLPVRLARQLNTQDGRGEGAYERSHFGHGWQDFDKDGQDTRAELLVNQSTVPVVFASPDRKRVIHGRWISPFTGNALTDASDVEIDHVVPLAFAWRYGADEWTEERRVEFSNAPVNIMVVEASLNSSKKDRDITEWLPPSGICGYTARFIRVIKIFELAIPPEKQAAYHSLRQQCAASTE